MSTLWTSKITYIFHANIFRNCIPSSVFVCMCVCVHLCYIVFDISVTHTCILMQELYFVFWKTSLTLRDICKELQKPSVTNTYSVGFNNDTKLPCKKWIQKIILLGEILCKRIEQSVWPRKFWVIFPLYAGWGGTSPSVKNDFLHPFFESFVHTPFIQALPPLLILVYKLRKAIRIFSSNIFPPTFKIFSTCGAHFYKNL